MTSFKKTGWIATGLCVGMLMSSVANAEEGLGPVQVVPPAALSPTMDSESRELPSRSGPIAAIITGAATTAAFGVVTMGCVSTFSGNVGFLGVALLAPCGASAILTPLSAAHLVGGIAWLVAVNKWRDSVAREGTAHWTERVNVSFGPGTGSRAPSDPWTARASKSPFASEPDQASRGRIRRGELPAALRMLEGWH